MEKGTSKKINFVGGSGRRGQAFLRSEKDSSLEKPESFKSRIGLLKKGTKILKNQFSPPQMMGKIKVKSLDEFIDFWRVQLIMILYQVTCLYSLGSLVEKVGDVGVNELIFRNENPSFSQCIYFYLPVERLFTQHGQIFQKLGRPFVCASNHSKWFFFFLIQLKIVYEERSIIERKRCVNK